jgi:hypothetical protein
MGIVAWCKFLDNRIIAIVIVMVFVIAESVYATIIHSRARWASTAPYVALLRFVRVRVP